MLFNIKKNLNALIANESSIQKLTLSFCIGNFIAFSPFIGLHWLMVLGISWLCRLNIIVVAAAAYGINNIWTALPIYSADYFFGFWLVHRVFAWQTIEYIPQWLTTFYTILEHYISLPRPCLWSFLIGGNVLGLLTSIMLYPIMWYIFSSLLAKRET